MNFERRAREGRPRPPAPRAAAKPAGAGQQASRWGVGILWVAAIGVTAVLWRGDQPRNVDSAGPRGIEVGGDLSPLGRPRGWSGGPTQPRPGLTGERRRAPALTYTYRRLLSLGDPAPGGGTYAGDIEISDLNDAGQAPIVSDAESGEVLYLVAPGRVKPIARPGEPTPAGSPYGGRVWTPQAINNQGQVVWSSEVENGETWTFLYEARTGRRSVVQRPGMAAPGGSRFQPGFRQRPVINERGEIAFVAYVPGRPNGTPVPGVFALLPDGMRAVARQDTAAPGGAGFSAAASPAINASGTIVFHATVGSSDALGVYRWQAGAITSIAPPGTRVAGGRRLDQALYPQIDGSGRIVFVGWTRRGSGIYRWVDGVIRPIVLPGDPCPGVGWLQSVDFERRKPFHLNPSGALVFSGRVGSQDGVFVWEQGKVRVVALSDLALPGVGIATEVGTLGRGGRGGYGPPGYGYPAAPSAPPVMPGPTPGSRPASPGPPGGPGLGMPGGYGPPGGMMYPYGGFGGSFGLALSDNGKVLFAATVGGTQSLILATPKRPVPGVGLVEKAGGFQPRPPG